MKTKQFTRSRTEGGRSQSTCDSCGESRASWTPRQLDRWQQTHQCNPLTLTAAAAVS